MREYKSPVARRRERIVMAIEGAIYVTGIYGLAWLTWAVIRMVGAG